MNTPDGASLSQTLTSPSADEFYLIWRVLVGKGAEVPLSVSSASHDGLGFQVVHEGQDLDGGTVVIEILVPGPSTSFWDWAAPSCDPNAHTIAMTTCALEDIPPHVSSVLSLPRDTEEQRRTINAVLDLYGCHLLLTGSLEPEQKCTRKGRTIEFHDIEAEDLQTAVEGLKKIYSRYESIGPVGAIGIARYVHHLHFPVFEAFAEIFEAADDAYGAEVHPNISCVWREGLRPGVSVLLIGSR